MKMIFENNRTWLRLITRMIEWRKLFLLNRYFWCQLLTKRFIIFHFVKLHLIVITSSIMHSWFYPGLFIACNRLFQLFSICCNLFSLLRIFSFFYYHWSFSELLLWHRNGIKIYQFIRAIRILNRCLKIWLVMWRFRFSIAMNRRVVVVNWGLMDAILFIILFY